MTNPNVQKSDVVAAQQQVWGGVEQMCATRDCPNEAEKFSCYCEQCEQKIFESESV